MNLKEEKERPGELAVEGGVAVGKWNNKYKKLEPRKVQQQVFCFVFSVVVVLFLKLVNLLFPLLEILRLSRIS